MAEKYSELKKSDLPVYTIPGRHRDTSNRDYAIVLALFEGWEGVPPLYHLNSAMWVYNSLLVNSNLSQTDIPVIFYVEDKCLNDSDFRRRLVEGNIPDEIIWEFQREEVGRFTSYYIGPKMYPLWDPRFANFENVLIWDTDLFLGTYHDKTLDINTLFRRNHPSQPGATFPQPEKPRKMRLDITYGVEGEELDKLHKEITTELTGRSYDNLFMVGGYLHSICPKHIKQSYKDFYWKALPVISDDEAIVSLWSIHYGEEIEDLANFVPKFVFSSEHLDHVIQFPECDPYLSHIYNFDGMDMPRWNNSIGILSKTHLDPLVPVDVAVDSYDIQPLVAYINVDRRIDRRAHFESTMREKGYIGEIHRITAVDKDAFDSYEALVQFAMRDYPNFEKMLDWNSPYVSYQLSYLKALEWILCQDKPVLLFEDDMTIKEDWETVLKRLSVLPPDFNIVMLNYNHIPAMQKELADYGFGWEIGLKSNGTSALMFSQSGAQVLYDSLIADPGNTAEMHLAMLDIEKCFSASPVIACTMPNAGESDLTPYHN